MSLEIAAIRGVTTHYGPRDTTGKFGGQVGSRGLVKQAVWTFDYSDLPAGSTHQHGVSLPAYTKIVNATFEVLTGFTSTSTTTDLTIGLEQADGTDIDLDGLVTAVQADQTVIATRGNTVVGTGALVGKSIGANAGELVVTPTTADLLTGRGRVIVEYIVEGV